MAVNPMPYTGIDVIELARLSPASGTRSNSDAEERRAFRVDWANRNAFMNAMLNNATLPDSATMVCQQASYRGEGPGAVVAAGQGGYAYAVVELGYKPVKAGSSSGGEGPTVAYEESTDFGAEVLALPTRLFKRWGTHIDELPNIATGYGYSFIRRVYTIKGLGESALSPGSVVAVQNRLNTGGMLGVDAECVRLTEVRSQQTFLSDGTSVINATIGIDIRENSWNKFYLPETKAWDWYYLDKDGTQKYEQYETTDISSFLSSLGVTSL